MNVHVHVHVQSCITSHVIPPCHYHYVVTRFKCQASSCTSMQGRGSIHFNGFFLPSLFTHDSYKLPRTHNTVSVHTHPSGQWPVPLLADCGAASWWQTTLYMYSGYFVRVPVKDGPGSVSILYLWVQVCLVQWSMRTHKIHEIVTFSSRQL